MCARCHSSTEAEAQGGTASSRTTEATVEVPQSEEAAQGSAVAACPRRGVEPEGEPKTGGAWTRCSNPTSRGVDSRDAPRTVAEAEATSARCSNPPSRGVDGRDPPRTEADAEEASLARFRGVDGRDSPSTEVEAEDASWARCGSAPFRGVDGFDPPRTEAEAEAATSPLPLDSAALPPRRWVPPSCCRVPLDGRAPRGPSALAARKAAPAPSAAALREECSCFGLPRTCCPGWNPEGTPKVSASQMPRSRLGPRGVKAAGSSWSLSRPWICVWPAQGMSCPW